MINIPKGTKDVLPSESYKWQYVEGIARSVCALYNAREIRTPVFEHTELFSRSIGEATDVVNKEMYTFIDKGGRSLTLKPEGTAGVARCFIENSLYDDLPLKAYYFSPVYRYERPQAGRYREHHQFGVEFYGSGLPECDCEVIALAFDFLKELGVTNALLTLNSIGCNHCRAAYNEALRGYLASLNDSLCNNCRERAVKNPLRALDCKDEGCQNLYKNAPEISDFLCSGCRGFDAKLKQLLTDNNIEFKYDKSLVRGLDYYTKTVFEFVDGNTGLALFGGGRYDNLIAELGGKPTPCVGFGMGIERLLMWLEALNLIPENNPPQIFVACQSENERGFCISLVKSLRQCGISADTDIMGKSLKAQLKQADRQGFKYCVVIGGNETGSGTVMLKKMKDGTQINCKITDLVNTLRREKTNERI